MISILNSFKSEFIALHASEFVQILSNSSTEAVSKAQIFRAFGKCISRCPTPAEQRIDVFKAAFGIINNFTDLTEYIECVEAWTQFIAEHFSVNLL